MTTDEYLSDTEESHRRRQLTMGVLSEPPAPFYGHQCVLLTTARLMADHVEQEWLGRIAIAPLDVILDHERNLVVQPDILFIAAGRGRIIRNQVWGPPDLVVEVLSLSTERHDRGEKLEWYRHYGVRECWLVDAARQEVTVMDFTGDPPAERIAGGDSPIVSAVLPGFAIPASRLFA